jgi:sugar phosphate permease
MDQQAVLDLARQVGGFLMLGFVVGIAAVGQWIKKHEKWDSRLAVAGMLAMGMGVYGLRHGWPSGFAWDTIEQWLTFSVPFGLTIVGTASTLGHFFPKQLKTDSKKEAP